MKHSDANHSGEDPVTGQDQTVFVDVPTELGPYRLIRILGRGGMGEVWQAFDTNLERDVAVKLMRRELLANEEAVRRFGREARAVARLNHPNIVQVYAFGDQHGVLYFVMEMVEGETVGDVIKRQGTLTLEQSASVMLQSIEGLSYASVRGIVHRDIKPSNLMLTTDGRVKIADFGLARMMEQDSQVTAAGSTMGSPNYMSPEQARGEEADHRSDIYSLGITFYQMLTGQLPFTAHTPLSVLLMQIQNPLPEPHFLKEMADGRALSIIKRMTQKNAADRYQAYAELAAEVAALAPAVRIGHSAYAGTMSMPTPGAVPANAPSVLSGEAPAPRLPMSGTFAAAGEARPVTGTTKGAISEEDLQELNSPLAAVEDPEEAGATRTLAAPALSGGKRRRALAVAAVAVPVTGLVLLGAFLFSSSGTTSKGLNSQAGSSVENATSSVGPSAGDENAAATMALPSPAAGRPATESSTGLTVVADPASASSPAAVSSPGPGGATPPHSPVPTPAPAGYAGAPGNTVGNPPPTPLPFGAAPTPPLYAMANPPLIPSPTPVLTATPVMMTARYADLAPSQSPNSEVQLYTADGRPAFKLPARTRVEYLEAASIQGNAMMKIAYRGQQGFVPMDQAAPVYAPAGMSSQAEAPAPPPSNLPRSVMVGRPGGTGKYHVFDDERGAGRILHTASPGTVLPVDGETPGSWVVRLPNGRNGHVLKKLATPQP